MVRLADRRGGRITETGGRFCGVKIEERRGEGDVRRDKEGGLMLEAEDI
jgi:hypothetical protein